MDFERTQTTITLELSPLLFNLPFITFFVPLLLIFLLSVIEFI